MSRGLEQIMKPGLKVSGNKHKVFPSFVEEIKDFKKTRNKEKVLPFVNQEEVLPRIARALSGSYPSVVLVGEPGVGKSMVLDYVVDLLLGNIESEQKYLFEDISNRLHEFETLHYLFLPNLSDPFNVTPIDYNSREEALKEFDAATNFAEDFSDVIKDYAKHKFGLLKREATKDNFIKFLDDKIVDFYSELYDNIELIVDKGTNRADLKDKEPIMVYKFEVPEDPFEDISESKIEIYVPDGSSINFEKIADEAGFNERIKEYITESMFKVGFSYTLGNEATELFGNYILENVKRIDVIGLNEKEKRKLLSERFAKFNNEVLGTIKEFYDSGKIKDMEEISSHISKNFTNSNYELKVSKETKEAILKDLRKLRDEYTKKDFSDEFNNRISSFVDYFHNEEQIFEMNLTQFMDTVSDYQESVRETSSKKDISKKKFYDASDIYFSIEHAGNYIDIEDVLRPRILLSSSSSQNNVTVNTVSSSNRRDLFAEFEKTPDNASPDFPPHARINNLGTFFRGSILRFGDAFRDFINIITNSTDTEKSMKEQFLEYLQTKVMTIENKGVKYNIRAPKVILGCDNEDPFISTKGFFYENEIALRERIKEITVKDYAVDSPKVRRGTLQVIYDTVDKFNNNLDEKTRNIRITDKAVDMLLQKYTSLGKISSLRYRKITQDIEDTLSYSLMSKKNIVSAQTMKDLEKENIPEHSFMHIDWHFKSFKELGVANVGLMQGLSVWGDYVPGAIGFQSYYQNNISEKDKKSENFEFVDITSNLTGNDTKKGYDLAIDFIKSLFNDNKEMIHSKKIKTFTVDDWDKFSGSSASMAITLSILSALSEEGVYRNRFITGTINPVNGKAGVIGGSYDKGMGVLRIKDLLEQEGINENVYFLLPEDNIEEFSKGLIFDTFNMEKKIGVFPIKNVWQAYHLVTCGPNISKGDWYHAEKLGKEKLNKIIQKP